jgi:sugar lactone lactonase YvrE
MTWQILNPNPDQLGESPFWHPDEQMLYWVDIPGQQIKRANVYLGSVESWDMPAEPGCIAPVRSAGRSDGLLLALRDGIYRATQWGGSLERVVGPDYDSATTRFNDGKADPAGRFWVGTIFEPRTAPQGELFSLDLRAGVPALQRHAGGVTVANGLAWSPDARTLYWTDTTRQLIRAWDWDAGSGQMSGERVFAQWPGKPEGWQPGMAGYGGRPDGAAVDVEGNYWVAMFEGARVLQLSPQGQVLRDIAVPAQCPTMPCFGGADLKTLYVTTASRGRSAAELAAWPDSGCVFSMQVEVPGLPVNFVDDARM